MADSPSAFGKVLQLQRSQLTPRRAERKSVAMTTSLAAYFPLPQVQNNSFQQVPGTRGCGGGERSDSSPATALGQSPVRFGGKRKVAANQEAWRLCHRPEASLE